MNGDERPPRTTLTDGKPVYPEHVTIIEEGPRKGQQQGYVVLAEEERAKGFVRPYRTSYLHVGALGPKYPLRDLLGEEKERYGEFGYVKYEKYVPSPNAVGSTGRFWTQDQLNRVGKGCQTVTTMGRTLSETYARDPKFYGGTFCAGCQAHFPVEEFTWVGTDERVGS